jgi:ribonuclease BN (tRNA processing enzyme)
MKLEFLGRGGAFFPEEGNTSAFFIENKTLFLIDCGESVFGKIVQTDLLKKNQIEEVYCFVTHMHSDHTGSLSSLIYYCFYMDIANPIHFSIVCADRLTRSLYQMLDSQGCADFFDFVSAEMLSNRYWSFSEVRFIRTVHQGHYPAFCIEFTTDSGKVFYSGDTRDLDLVSSYVQKGEEIDQMYLETTLLDYSGNAHLPLRALNEIIPKNLRTKVYLMHFNNADCIAKAEELGFQVVQCITK